MESSYSIQPVERLVRMQVWGELTVDGLIGLIDRVGADEHYRSSMHAIADFRQAFGNWDYSEIQRYRDYLARIAGHRDCRRTITTDTSSRSFSHSFLWSC